MDLKLILKKIEELRNELEKLGEKKGVDDPQVVEKSKELDEYLNKYKKLRGM